MTDRRGASIRLAAPAPHAGAEETVFAYRHPDGSRLDCSFPELTDEGLARLHRARQEARQRLLDLSLRQRCRLTAAVLAPWRQNQHSSRALAEKWLPLITGYSPAVVRAGLDDLTERLDEDGLLAMVTGIEAAASLSSNGTQRQPFGPPWSLLIAAGNIPGVALFSIAVSLIAGAPAVVKVAAAQPLLPLLLQRDLAAAHPELAGAVWPVYWSRRDLDGSARALVETAPALIVYGRDETVARYQRRAGPGTNFVAHGHRFSAAVLGSQPVLPGEAGDVFTGLARDVALFDQQGCLSPQVLYVVGSRSRAAAAAHGLHQALQRTARELPPGKVPGRALGELRQLAETERFLSSSEGSVFGQPGTGLVLLQDEPGLRLSPLYRTVWVRPIPTLTSLAGELGEAFSKVSTLGAAGLTPQERGELMGLAGPAGVSRITAWGQMQRPPATWHHDGRLEIERLMQWCEVDASQGH